MKNIKVEDITEDFLRRFIVNKIDGKKPSMEVLERYRAKNNANNLNYLDEQYIKELPVNSIIFISDRPNFFFLRVSKALIEAGYRTILLTRWGVDNNHRLFFNDVLLFDSLLDLYNLSKAKEIFIYVQSWIGWFFLPVFLKLITRVPVYCNVNDSSMLLFNDIENFQYIGIDTDDALLDILCERYIYNNLSLVTHPYEDLNLPEKISCSGNVKYFPCYCLKDFSLVNRSNYDNHEDNLIFIGGIPYDDKSDVVFKDAKIHKVSEKILNLGVNLKILNNPMLTQSNDEFRKLYPFFYNLTRIKDNFTFMSGYPPWELYEHTKDATYGIMIYDFSDILISQNHIRAIIPTKFFTYLELGLPIIVVNSMESVAKLVKKYHLGIVLPYDRIDNLNSIIDDNRSK